MGVNMRKIVFSRRAAAVGAALVLVGGGAAFGVVRAVAKPPSALALTPGNFTALRAAETARADVPTAVHSPAPGYGPAAGTVHALGRGKAFAWIREGAVCWSSGVAAGCANADATGSRGFDAVISDADEVGRGEPTRVAGLAVDEVVSLTATLEDGSALTAAPHDNWYEITLPGSAAPWDVDSVSARLRSGRTVSLDVTLSAPALH